MGFLSPIFLYGLLGAAIPVLIHLVRQATARNVPFPSLMLLQDIKRQYSKRRRLKDIFLLLVRSLMLALLAMLFARPFVQDTTIPMLQTEPRASAVLLIDVSMSMQANNQADQARDAALQQLEASADGDEFAVVLFDRTAKQLTNLSDDLEVHRQALETIESGYGTTDIHQALLLGAEILQSARHRTRRLVLISDMQRSGFGVALQDWVLPEGIAVETLPTESATGDNPRIEDFILVKRRRDSGTLVRYNARIEGVPQQTASDIVLEIDSRIVNTANVSGRYTYQHVLSGESVAAGRLILSEDALDADNSHYFTREIAGPPVLLAVDGGHTAAREDRIFLETAFSLTGFELFDFRRLGQGQLSAARLAEADALVLSSLSGLTAAQLAAIDRFVFRGGGLILAFGQGADQSTYQTLLDRLGMGDVSGIVESGVGRPSSAIIGQADMQHPIFQPFTTSGSGAVFRPRFTSYAKLAPDSTNRVVASFDSGDPMLVEGIFGAGRVLVYASSLGMSWTDFPIHETWIPFVYELASHATDAQSETNNLVGSVVRIQGNANAVWDVRSPDGAQYQIEADDQGLAAFRSTAIPGHYLAVSGSDRRLFSVNVDPVESELEFLDPDEAFAAGTGSKAQSDGSSVVQAEPEDLEERQRFWLPVLGSLLLLFGVESIVSHRKRVVPLHSASVQK